MAESILDLLPAAPSSGQVPDAEATQAGANPPMRALERGRATLHSDEERAAIKTDDLRPENLSEFRRAIDTERDPKKKAILQGDYDQLIGQGKQIQEANPAETGLKVLGAPAGASRAPRATGADAGLAVLQSYGKTGAIAPPRPDLGGVDWDMLGGLQPAGQPEKQAPWFGETGEGVLSSTPAGFVAQGKQAVAGFLQMLNKQAEVNVEAQQRGRTGNRFDQAITRVDLPPADLEAVKKDATEAGERMKEWAAQNKRDLELVTPKDMSLGQEIVWSAITSSGSTALGIGVGIATRNPTLAVAVAGGGGFQQQAGSSYLEALDHGATHDVAMRSALRQGFVESLDALPVGYALNNPGTRKTFLTFLEKTLKTAGVEGATEGAQQALQDFDAFMAYNPKMTMGEAWHNFVVAVGAGTLTGGTIGGAGHAYETMADRGAQQPAAQPPARAPGPTPTHLLPDGTPVAMHQEEGKPVPGLWKDEQGNLHEAPAARPLQMESNAEWVVNGIPYEVEVLGKGERPGSAALSDGQEVSIASLVNMDDDAKVRLGLIPPKDVGETTEKPTKPLKIEGPSSPQTSTEAAPAAPAEPPKPPPSMEPTRSLQRQNRLRESAASVEQMNRIANAPDYDRLSFSKAPETGAPMASFAGDTELPAAQLGRSSTVTISDEKVPVRYAVVEAKDLIASNLVSGKRSEEFFQDPKPGELRALNNGRAAGIKEAYGRDTAGAYKSAMIGDPDHGIDPKIIEGMARPVLIRLYPDEWNTKIANIGEASQGETLQLSPLEHALGDAAKLTSLEDFKPDESGDVLAPQNMAFVNRFLQDVVPEAERGRYFDQKGRPNKAAVDRIEAAVFQKAYGSKDLTSMFAEQTDPEIRAVLSALSIASPEMAKLEGAPPEMDLRPYVAESAKLMLMAKRQGVKLSALLAQGDIEGRNPLVEKVAQFMAENVKSPKKMAAGLAEGAKFAQFAAVNQASGDMFGGGEITVSHVLERIKTYMEQNYGAKTEGPSFFTPEGAQAVQAPENQPGARQPTGRYEAPRRDQEGRLPAASESGTRPGGTTQEAVRQQYQNLKGESHAATTGKEQERGLEQHRGNAPGPNVRENQGEVRQGDRGQASGSRGAVERETAPGDGERRADAGIQERGAGEGARPEPSPGPVRGAEVRAPAHPALPTADLRAAARATETEPSLAQIEAGNYAKGKYKWNGLTISLENPKGSIRRAVDGSWEQTMAHHYGYIRGTLDRTGEQIDTFIGPNPKSDQVYVIEQEHQGSGIFDEPKVMIGFGTVEEAKRGYLDNYPRGWKVGPVVPMNVEQFKTWLEGGNTKARPSEIPIEQLIPGLTPELQARAEQIRDQYARGEISDKAYAKFVEKLRSRWSPPEAPAAKPQGAHTVEGIRDEINATEFGRRVSNMVEPVARINDLPEYIYEDVKDKGDFAINNVNGVWDPISRKVYLVAANTDPGSVNQTLLHELVGHYGVESILGPKFSEFLRQVYDSNAPAIQQQARAGFLVPYNLDFTKAAHREIAASEYIAYTAERGENPSLWQRFVAKVREILRSMGFVKEWSENDIRNLLRRSRNSLMHGGDVSYNGETPYEFGQPDYTSGREVQAPRRKGATLYGEPKGKSVESHVSQSDLEARKEYWRKNMPESAVIRATPMWETGPKYSVRQTTFAKDDAGHPLLSGELVDVVNPRFVREQPNGVRIYTHDILVGKTHVGVVMLGWQGDTVTDLPFIAVFPKFKGLGLGEDVVRSILEHNGGKPLRAVLVLAQARTFWSKMGAKFEATEEGEDGILTYQNYLAQNRGRGAARAGGTVATRESAVEEINAGSETAPGAEVPRQRYSIRDPKGLSQVYGVKDGRLQGVAIKSYRGGIWEVYIGKEGNPTLFAQGDFDRIQASDIGEVQRIFNQKGLEFRAIKPTNIPIPDRSIFDRNWVAPTADTFFKRATIYLQNRLLLPELQERVIAREVGPIPEEAKAHREARLAHPRAAGKMADFDHQYTEPIIEEMRKARLTLREVGDYLYARHAEERNVAIEQINPENKSGSGMPTEEAQATLRTLQQDTNRWAALERIGKLVNEVNKVREQIMVDKGLAKPQAIALLRAKYKNYVPLKEMAEDEYIQSPIGGGYQVGRVINTAFGRFTRANSDLILPASIAQAKGTIAAGENAEVLRALLRQAEFAPNPDVWRLQKAVWKPYLDRDTGEVRYAPRPVQMDANYGSRAISIPVDGDRHVLIVSDQRFADAFKRSGLPLPDFMQTIGTVTRFYALMATAANPEFVVTNLMRDFQQAMIRLTGEKSPALASKVAKDMIPALWGAFSGLRAQGQYTPGESAKPLAEAWHSWYRRFIEAGGQVAYRGIADVETQHKDFLRSLADAGIYPESLGGFQSVLLKAHRAAKVSGAKFFTKLVTDANGAVENALRLSTFKNLVEAGYTEKDAAFAARNVTVDFNLKGEASTRIGALWMFFNANMQGNALLVRSVINSKGVRWLAYALFFMGMAMDAWNRRHANENKDGRTSYDNISSDMKEKNFVLMAPDGDNAITVPFSFGFNIFYMAGVNAMATIDGAQKPLKSAMNVVIGAMNAFNPMGQTPTTSLGTLQLISPTSSDPAVQAMTNRDWRDKTIVPERPKFAPPQSKAETYYSGTPPMYVDSARWLNEMSGGNEVRSGILDISPNMLRHWVNSVFGSAGATYARIADIVHATATDKELETRDIPIVRRFYYEPKDFELSHRFYEHLNEAEVAHFEVRRAYEGNRGEQARLLQEEYRGERSMYQEGVAAERTVGQIRSQIAHLRKDERVPEDVKKKRIEQAEEQSRRIMMQFNARFESSVDR